MTGPVVIFVGPPTSGKTSVGRLVADKLGVGFRDTDADVEAMAGKPVADIFVEDGEPEFRRLEEEAIARAVAQHDGVLALGGGAIVSEQTRKRLAGRTVVFLDVSLPDAAVRAGFNRDRPLLLGNPRGQLRRMLAERRPLYLEVATVTVSTDGTDPDTAAERVLAELAERGL